MQIPGPLVTPVPDTPEYGLLTPSGRIATGLSVSCTAEANLAVGPDGEVDDDGFDDFPTFAPLTMHGVELVADFNGGEFLVSHCRLVTIEEDYDKYDGQQVAPWPEHIVNACKRVAALANVVMTVDQLRRWAPADIGKDPTITAVLDNIILGRVQGEIDELEATIAAFREGRVEPTHVGEIDEEDDAELLDKADQKHAAQMEDMSDD